MCLMLWLLVVGGVAVDHVPPWERCRGHASSLDREPGAAALCVVCALFRAGPGAAGAVSDSRALCHHIGLDGCRGWLCADWFIGWGITQHLVSAPSGGLWGAALSPRCHAHH